MIVDVKGHLRDQHLNCNGAVACISQAHPIQSCLQSHSISGCLRKKPSPSPYDPCIQYLPTLLGHLWAKCWSIYHGTLWDTGMHPTYHPQVGSISIISPQISFIK